MQVVYPVCCGIDVHKTFLVATIIKTNQDVDANTPWGSLMRERHRKTLAVCPACHKKIHETTKP